MRSMRIVQADTAVLLHTQFPRTARMDLLEHCLPQDGRSEEREERDVFRSYGMLLG